jgi:hypothetical protein
MGITVRVVGGCDTGSRRADYDRRMMIWLMRRHDTLRPSMGVGRGEARFWVVKEGSHGSALGGIY